MAGSNSVVRLFRFSTAVKIRAVEPFPSIRASGCKFDRFSPLRFHCLLFNGMRKARSVCKNELPGIIWARDFFIASLSDVDSLYDAKPFTLVSPFLLVFLRAQTKKKKSVENFCPLSKRPIDKDTVR